MSRIITQATPNKFRVPCGYGIPENMFNVGIANCVGRADQDAVAFRRIKNDGVGCELKIDVECGADCKVKCDVKCSANNDDYLVLGVFDGHGGRIRGANGAATLGVRVINSLSNPKNKYGLTGTQMLQKFSMLYTKKLRLL